MSWGANPWSGMGGAIAGGLGGIMDLLGYFQNQGQMNQMQSSLQQMQAEQQGLYGNITGAAKQMMNPADISQAMQLYSQMAQSGLPASVRENAMNQLQQQYQTALNTNRAEMAPGANPQAMSRDALNAYIQGSGNLSANLTQQDMQARLQGAQGIGQMSQYGMSSLDNLYNSLAQQQRAYAQMAQQMGGGGSQMLGGALSGIMGLLPLFGL